MPNRTRIWTAAATVLAVLAGAPAAPASSVDYGPISHKGLKTVGAASTSLKLPLQIGFVANQSGLQSAIKSASNPASSSYGKYPSLSTLQSKYGASSSKRKSVVNTFKSNGITATVDVTHLRVSATVSVGKAQKMFGTKWKVYKTDSGSKVALPVNTPKLPKGIKGNVDTVAGMRLQISGGSSSSRRASRRRRRRWDADADRVARLRLRAGDLPRRAGLGERSVPEPDPHGLRDRAAAGVGPAGSGRPGRDRGRGADAGGRRERIPLVLRLRGHSADDPQRRQRSSRSSRAPSTP